MSNRTAQKFIVAALCTGGLGSAHAVAELEVNGRADTNADFSFESSKEDSVIGDPLARTVISVSDSNSIFSYFALSDFTVPKMQLKGTWNNGGSPVGNFETAILAAKARIQETFSVDVPSPTPYRITAELFVTGVLDVDGSDGIAQALLTLDPTAPDRLSGTDSGTYNTNGIVSDTLSVSFDFTDDATFDLDTSIFLSMRRIDANTSISIDFSNTALLSIKVTTLGGDPLPEVVVESGSGQFGVTPVPAPAALPLLLSGLGVVGWRAKRT